MVIGMAHFAANVGCDLIAEGIETANELTALKLLGVAFGQGYLLGKPASVDAARSAMPAAGGGNRGQSGSASTFSRSHAGRGRGSDSATPPEPRLEGARLTIAPFGDLAQSPPAALSGETSGESSR